MATFSSYSAVRDDFRCSLCRQKNTFHCEHDTPYRDQLLGTYEQEKPSTISTHGRRESHRSRSQENKYHNSSNNHTMQNTHNGHPNGDPRYLQSNRPVNVTSPNQYQYPKTTEDKKQKKGCIIL